MARKKNVSLASTEPQARKVLEGIEKRRKKRAAKPKDTGGRTTAKTPKGVQKTEAQGEKELAAIRKKQKARIKKSKQRKIYEANNK